MVGLLAAMAHPQRLQILLKLLGGEATHRLLAKATGLKPGPLYHHLRELRMAGLIGPKTRDLYFLAPAGRYAILAALAMARLCR
jgi:DNA-binding transcriptional ArsR family regulator